MFKNPGTKLKTIVQVLFWITSITCAILAIVLGISREEHGYYIYYIETVFHPEFFFPLLIGGPAFSYLAALFFYMLGDSNEKTNMICEKMDREKMDRIEDNSACPDSEDNSACPDRSNSVVDDMSASEEGEAVCPACGQKRRWEMRIA